jgi:hypothetical protein
MEHEIQMYSIIKTASHDETSNINVIIPRTMVAESSKNKLTLVFSRLLKQRACSGRIVEQ